MSEQGEKPGSYFINGYIEARDGDPFLIVSDESGIRIQMDGYAIIPMERYRQMQGLDGHRCTQERDHWPCAACGATGPNSDGHDPCIASLPGIVHACCGHGVERGYAMFDDGRVIRGAFDHCVPNKPDATS